MVTAVSALFQSIFNDSLSKFIQPTYLTTAFIFVLLNFMFIYPDMVAHNIIYIIYLNNINPVIQAILVAAIVLILAYMLLSLNSFFLTILTGELWEKSSIGRGLIWLHVLQDDDESAQSFIPTIKQWLGIRSQGPNSATGSQNNQQPPPTAEEIEAANRPNAHVCPTSLGNEMNKTADNVWKLYRIQMSALWSHMEIILSDTSHSNNASVDPTNADNARTALKARIDNEKATLDFLVTLTVVLGLFALEEVFIQFCWLYKTPDVLWGPIVFLLLAYIVYRAAVVKAHSWGDAVQIAFDMYRFELQKRLDIRPFTSAKDEREVWKNVSELLLESKHHDEVFIGVPPYPPHSPTITVTSSANVKVTPFSSEHEEDTLSTITYVLIVDTIETSKDVAKSIYVLVSDARIKKITSLPEATLGENKPTRAHVLHTDEPKKVDLLLWHINELPCNSSTVISYSLPYEKDKNPNTGGESQ